MAQITNLRGKIFVHLKKKKAHIALLSLMYLAGLIGLNLDYSRALFLQLTPFHICLATFLLYMSHPDKGLPFNVFTMSTIIIGWAIECIGTNSGLIFGDYQYETGMGILLLGTPIIIGVNWLLMVLCIAPLFHQLKTHSLAKILLSAITITAFDYIIEPVAIHLQYWSWDGNIIPFQNFIGWFFTSLIFVSLYYYMPFKKSNPLALPVFLLQTIFFIVLLLLFI